MINVPMYDNGRGSFVAWLLNFLLLQGGTETFAHKMRFIKNIFLN